MNGKIPVVIILLIILLLVTCKDRKVDSSKSDFYYYTIFKRNIVGKYRESLAGLKLWYCTIKIDADAETFVVISQRLGKDKDNIFFGSTKITNVDASSFVLKEEQDYCYDKDHVFQIQIEDIEKGLLSVIGNANPQTYEQINRYFGKDDSHMYFFNNKVIETDVSNMKLFRFMSYNTGADDVNIYDLVEGIAYPYSGKIDTIADNVFHDDKQIFNLKVIPKSIIPISNVNTIQLLDTTSEFIFIADNSLYWNMQKIENLKVDPLTFEHVGDLFYKDKNHVYYMSEILKNADPSTFRFVKDEGLKYFQDKKYRWKYNTNQKKWILDSTVE